MLDPMDRRHLFDALRPPEGYDVGVALGTTFSLDLMTLLTVPLSFALFDWEDDEGRLRADPLSLLEAVRRYAGRTHIFCQAGRIALPRQHSPLMHQLEGIVHEVTPKRDRGVFHPKVWILRFEPKCKDDQVLYRLLCLSRNLTFDRSWDTMLVLEGVLTDRTIGIGANHPLGEFVLALPGLMLRTADQNLADTIGQVAQEIRKVRFEPPAGFDAVGFHALGISDGDWWFNGRCDRMLAMAPFVDGQFVNRLVKATNGDCALVSRLEQLTELTPGQLNGCKNVFYLDPLADDDESADDAGAPAIGVTTDDGEEFEPGDESLSGLHAKFFVADAGWEAKIWTGSANATTAAMSRNVEFMVELTGKKAKCGVDEFLKTTKGETHFADMLRSFTPGQIADKKDSDVRKAEELVDRTRMSLVKAHLHANVTMLVEGNSYQITLVPGAEMKSVAIDGVVVKVWPASLPERAGIAGQDLLKNQSVAFGGLSFEALTTFFAFSITASVGTATQQSCFVMNLPTEGMPTDRQERLLRAILQNRSQVLKMLLLLLTDSGNGFPLQILQESSDVDHDASSSSKSPLGNLALLEPLLVALDRDPKKLERVAKLVLDLQKMPDSDNLLPPGFAKVWEPIWHVAQLLIHEHQTP